jgi:hypothetical protein
MISNVFELNNWFDKIHTHLYTHDMIQFLSNQFTFSNQIECLMLFDLVQSDSCNFWLGVILSDPLAFSKIYPHKYFCDFT